MTITTHPGFAFARSAPSSAPPFTRDDLRALGRAVRPPGWRPSTALLSVLAIGSTAFLLATDRGDAPVPLAPPVAATPEPAVDPRDLPLGSMYHVVDQIGARELWNEGITGAGVNVAVIDTGVAPVDGLTADGKVVAAVDLSSEAGNPMAALVDTNGHGTHMAGIIAGRETDADPATAAAHPQWFLGVAPDAGIVSVKVGNREGGVIPGSIAAGVDWVVDNAERFGIRVVNLSVGSEMPAGMPYRVDPLVAAVQRAWDAGIVVVTSAGNLGPDTDGLMAPADNPYVIAVAGADVEADGVRVAEWASAGDGIRNPDLAAPGTHIQSLRAAGSDADVNHPKGYIDAETFQGSGSSQSAAMVSGAAALLLDARPSLTNDQVKALLTRSAAPMAASPTQVGAGLLDVAAANRLPVPTVEQTWPRGDLSAEPLTSTADLPVVTDGWGDTAWFGATWWKAGATWWGATWWKAGATWWGATWWKAGATWWGATWWRAGATWWGATWWRAGATWW